MQQIHSADSLEDLVYYKEAGYTEMAVCFIQDLEELII